MPEHMKINRLKLLIVALVSASFLLAGCEDDRNNFMVSDSVSFVGTTEELQQIKEISIYDQTYDIPVVKNGKGMSAATVHLQASQAALTAYNEAHGTAYAYLPENCYEMTSALHFGEGDFRKFATIKWDLGAVAALDASQKYVIPLELSVEGSALPVVEDRKQAFITLLSASASMGSFTTSSMDGDLVFDGQITLNTPISTLDVTIDYAIDNSLVDAYNEANGTSYKAAPEGMVSLVASSSSIAAGETSTTFACRVSLQKFKEHVTELQNGGGFVVPVSITSVTEGVTVAERTAYVPLFDREIKGPWELREGYEIGWAFGPTNPGNAMYTGARLFDGSLTNEWIPYINGNDQNEFPMVFVADLGQPHIFTKFLIADSYNFQGSYRDYEIYISDNYDGANTVWTKVASGMRDYTYCVEANTSPFIKDHPDLTYDYPIQQVAMGRYLKFVILKCESTRDNGIAPSPCGGGKLADVWGAGL